MKKPTNCDGCGVCCMGQNMLPLFENDYLPPDMRASLDAVERGPCKGYDGEACIWLDRFTGKCQHHEYRPGTCRAFEIGGEACMRIRKAAGVEHKP